MEQEMTQSEYNNATQQQQQEIQRQEDNDPNKLYADSMREEKIANVIAQLDPSGLVDELEHKLRGERFNRQTQDWVKIGICDNQVSELLITRFVSFVGSILNQSTTLSNFSTNEINNRMEMIINFVGTDLNDNEVEYNLVDMDTEKTRIGLIILETISTVFHRALNGMEARRLFASLKVAENLTQNPTKAQGGIMDAMAFWK